MLQLPACEMILPAVWLLIIVCPPRKHQFFLPAFSIVPSLYLSRFLFPSYPDVSEHVLVMGSCLLVRLVLVLRLLSRKIILVQSVSTSHTLTAHKFLSHYI